MKNPTAKFYEGPKNYRKLVQNVPKLYSLSDKQLQESNPFEKNLIMTASSSRLRRCSAGGPQIVPKERSNSDGLILSYLGKPLTSAGKLESRQINEVAGRSLNIWRNSKKRLSNPFLKGVPQGLEASFAGGKDHNSGDYWDTKRSSKAFNLSWKTRQARLWNGPDSISSGIYLSYNSKNYAKLAKKDKITASEAGLGGSTSPFQLTPSNKLFLPPKNLLLKQS